MQIDMHYYGVYCLARMAGLRQDAAETIAGVSQYVDDSTAEGVLIRNDCARFKVETTAHSLLDLDANTDPDDQLQVWVPFHFMPGGEGPHLSDMLVCTKNSKNAQGVLAACLKEIERPCFLQLAGVAAHMYADTFAHHGFAGISTSLNRVKGGSITLGRPPSGQAPAAVMSELERSIRRRAPAYPRLRTENRSPEGFWDRVRHWAKRRLLPIASFFAEDISGALGHSAVATLPDVPFLQWSFQYEAHDSDRTRAQTQARSNPVDYLEACEALYVWFVQLANAAPRIADSQVSHLFKAAQVAQILGTTGDIETRSRAWQTAFSAQQSGTFQEQTIPPYNLKAWSDSRDQLCSLPKPWDAVQHPIYRFYQAASWYREFVLREYLPSNGIVLI
ncbi:MAG: DUF6765 family protein [Acidobacteriota bacterium]